MHFPSHPVSAQAGPIRSRRQWLRMAAGMGMGAAGLALVPEVRLFAQQVQDFIEGPPVPDVKPEQLSPHVWMVYAKEGFPTQENQGLMASIIFVVTKKGVVVLDSGASVQIGQMAIRMIKTVTPQPVIAVFNSHYHGDHWLGNHAFADTFGKELPIHALAHTQAQIAGNEGNLWRSLMERWTNQATLGTKVVAPNKVVEHGQVFDYGDVQIKLHHYGTAHTPSDLCFEIAQDKLTYIGDIAMENRIANMDDGSYTGTFKYYDALKRAAGDQLWLPGHGRGSKDLFDTYGSFMKGIYEPCLKAVKEGRPIESAKEDVLKDPRVASRAKTMLGFDSNIGKYTSLAYLEAEKDAF
jgi:glyoxylase-like metal-dependent hydrolase (beta-lactamase superfamily II)